MGVGFVLVEILLDKFLRAFECFLILLPFGLHDDLILDLALYGGFVLLPLAHDIGQDVLFS